MSKLDSKKNKSCHEAAINLPEAELEVLACLWRLDSATAREIREEMAAYRPMTHGAMVTLLKRLESKSLVDKKKAPKGKAFVYHAVQESKPVFKNIMRELHKRIFAGSGVAMVASLFETHPPSKEEVEELQALLDGLKKKASRK